jgi:hypothetical protein
MDARKFWTMCRLHDWYYRMSDDPGVYREGSEGEADLMRLAWNKPELTAIFDAWKEYHFGSGAKPEEPKMEDE